VADYNACLDTRESMMQLHPFIYVINLV